LSAIGVTLQVAYRLRRHFWLGWSLARWLGMVLAGAGLVVLFRYWFRPWSVALVAGALLCYLLFLVWAGRRGYIHFEASPDAQSLFPDAPAAPALGKEELLPVRASGWFTVEGKSQYYVDLEADFETVGTREHIILARVYPSRFLLLGGWPPQEIGWWYAFFQPTMIQQLAAGRLHFGARARLALQVVYLAHDQRPQMVHLTFENALALRRVWDDLLRDAPPGVVLGA
jgi:hypothetical protein